MRLDHLLASTPLGAPLEEAHRARAVEVLDVYGFTANDTGYRLDDPIDWVTIEEHDGLLHFHVQLPAPEHVLRTVESVGDGLVREAGLVRIDPLTRREISALDWSRRLADEQSRAYRKAF